jgi:hypothetical protein
MGIISARKVKSPSWITSGKVRWAASPGEAGAPAREIHAMKRIKSRVREDLDAMVFMGICIIGRKIFKPGVD